ncbi:hypothetical protein EX895_004919 [Sporisorium graminicola]|uniref:Uncharacterized protein n=1 Tax=Sporisorium graminicola TaxID=280036 RepID=A0A4U7KP60_9BASI|nr:hypothetical protein EX895_004919 [Sporisorium graminicola]TKY86094.1 hypothetical protein EX895_004919 [Sporisorium graminicola]
MAGNSAGSDKPADGSNSSAHAQKAAQSRALESAGASNSMGGPQQPAQPSIESIPMQSRPSSSSDTQTPSIAPTTAQALPAAVSSSTSSSPSSAVIAGAVLGGVVLLLALVSLVVIKRGHRKKAAKRTKQGGARHATVQNPWTSRSDLMGSLTDIQYLSFKTDHWPYLQRDRSRTAPVQDHVKVSLPSQPAKSDIREQRPAAITIVADHSGVELAPLSAAPAEALTDHDHNLLPKPRTREAETTVEGDDTQIDRCLSYYMKRRTCASMQPETMSALPSPLPQALDNPPSPTRAPTSAARISFTKFAKTANLLEKIRRSQIRLNDEALSKARSEGFRISRAPSHKIMTGREVDEPCPSPASFASRTEATKDDASSSFSPERQTGTKIPAHQRPHSKLLYQHGETPSAGGGDQDALGSSPAISEEPHSAFEYAEYYDSCLPAATSPARTPARQALTANDAEDAIVMPWGANHSPCRSSALSPRRSENMSIRQRSATFSQASPLAWPASLSVETDGDAAVAGRGGMGSLSNVSMQRESAQVDEVIRF